MPDVKTPEITVIKDAAETVFIRHPESSFGTFCYNEKGDLFLSSDYGMYGYGWRHYGKDGFKEFLKSLNAEYVFDKFDYNQRYLNKKRVPPFCKKHVLNLINEFITALKTA